MDMVVPYWMKLRSHINPGAGIFVMQVASFAEITQKSGGAAYSEKLLLLKSSLLAEADAAEILEEQEKDLNEKEKQCSIQSQCSSSSSSPIPKCTISITKRSKMQSHE